MCAASPPNRTTLGAFWAAIAELWGTLYFVPAPTSYSPRNSGDCAPSPSLTAAAQPTRSTYPWGFCFEDPFGPSSILVGYPVSGNGFCSGTGDGAEGAGGVDPEWSFSRERCESSRLVDPARRRGRATSTKTVGNSATGAEEQDVPPLFAGVPGRRKRGVSQPRSLFSQCLFAV